MLVLFGDHTQNAVTLEAIYSFWRTNFESAEFPLGRRIRRVSFNTCRNRPVSEAEFTPRGPKVRARIRPCIPLREPILSGVVTEVFI